MRPLFHFPSRRPMRILAASILYASLALGVGGCEQATGPSQVDTAEEDRRLMQAFDRRAEDTWVEAGGRVVRLLSDDHEGSRHQRFIVETGAGQTLLIAHNIDVAPRVPVGMGDRVRFRGV